MKFKVDENLPIEVVQFLRGHDHDAMSVGEQRLDGHPDKEIARVCCSEGRALITLDLDFSDIRAYPPEDHPGLMVLRPALYTVDAILRLVALAGGMLGSEPLERRLWIVEEQRIRIRGSSL